MPNEIGKLYAFDLDGCRYVGRLVKVHADGRYDLRAGVTTFTKVDAELSEYEDQPDARTLMTSVKERPIQASRRGVIEALTPVQRSPLVLISVRDQDGRLVQYGPVHRVAPWVAAGMAVAQGDTIAWSHVT